MNNTRTGQDWKIAAIIVSSCALYILLIKQKGVCMNDIVNILKKEIQNALCENEVPIACAIVLDNIIIAVDHNRRIAKCDPLAHAEILCIKKAAKAIKSWNLSNCIMYVTLEPCKMCKEVISECRIKRVYYYFSQKKEVNNNVKYLKIEDDNDIYFSNILKSFFADKR